MVTSTNRDGRRGNRSRNNEEKSPYTEKVVSIRRVSKVVKGVWKVSKGFGKFWERFC